MNLFVADKYGFNFIKRMLKCKFSYIIIHASMLKLQIISIINETENSKTFRFFTETKPEYKAGQFLTFEFTLNGNAVRRSYSLSSNPYTDEDLAITVKRESNGLLS